MTRVDLTHPKHQLKYPLQNHAKTKNLKLIITHKLRLHLFTQQITLRLLLHHTNNNILFFPSKPPKKMPFNLVVEGDEGAGISESERVGSVNDWTMGDEDHTLHSSMLSLQ
jgi:hypothetical protein